MIFSFNLDLRAATSTRAALCWHKGVKKDFLNFQEISQNP
jgi:hypothetical protein